MEYERIFANRCYRKAMGELPWVDFNFQHESSSLVVTLEPIKINGTTLLCVVTKRHLIPLENQYLHLLMARKGKG